MEEKERECQGRASKTLPAKADEGSGMDGNAVLSPQRSGRERPRVGVQAAPSKANGGSLTAWTLPLGLSRSIVGWGGGIHLVTLCLGQVQLLVVGWVVLRCVCVEGWWQERETGLSSPGFLPSGPKSGQSRFQSGGAGETFEKRKLWRGGSFHISQLRLAKGALWARRCGPTAFTVDR